MPQTIFNSYFLVHFESDTIITWGKEEDMYKDQYDFIQIHLQIVAFENLTQTMKSSLEFYTNTKETY